MMSRSPNLNQSVLGVIAGLAFYVPLFLRTFRDNRGNKLIECGSLAALSFFLLAASGMIPGFPIWVAVCMGTLTVLLALATLFIVAQRVFAAIRRRKAGRTESD
jgi:hypothetical protein